MKKIRLKRFSASGRPWLIEKRDCYYTSYDDSFGSFMQKKDCRGRKYKRKTAFASTEIVRL